MVILLLKSIFYKKIHKNMVEAKICTKLLHISVQIMDCTQIFMYFLIKNGLQLQAGSFSDVEYGFLDCCFSTIQNSTYLCTYSMILDNKFNFLLRRKNILLLEWVPLTHSEAWLKSRGNREPECTFLSQIESIDGRAKCFYEFFFICNYLLYIPNQNSENSIL